MAGVALLFVQEVRQAGDSGGDILIGLGLVLVAVLAASISNVMQIMPAMKAHPLAPMLGWAMLYGAAMDAAVRLDLRRQPGDGSAAGLLARAPLSRPDRVGSGVLALFRDHPQNRPAKAAYSSVLIPVIAMALFDPVRGLSLVGARHDRRRPRHRRAWSSRFAPGGLLPPPPCRRPTDRWTSAARRGTSRSAARCQRTDGVIPCG